MSGTHNKLWHENKFHHWKFSDLVLDLNYFSFSHHNPCRNQTYLPKHEFLIPNNQFYQRIWYVEYYSVHAYMVWSQKFRKSEISLDTSPAPIVLMHFTAWIRSKIHNIRRSPDPVQSKSSPLLISATNTSATSNSLVDFQF